MEPLVLGLRVLLALACVIGLIWVLARRAGWGKGRRRPAGPAVEVIGRHAFGRHAGVAVVAVGDRRLLLGYGEQNVTMLTELDPADPAEAAALAAEADAEAAAGATTPAPATPFTLGALVAAVLPRQRGTRNAPEPVRAPAPTQVRTLATAQLPTPASSTVPTPASPTGAGSFDAVLAEARAGVSLEGPDMSPDDVNTVSTSSGDALHPAQEPARLTMPAASATATATASATAAAAASAAAALAAAAAIPASPTSPASTTGTTASDVPGLAGLEVAEVDTARLVDLDRAAGEPADVRPGALHGSVLAPSTWKQAVAALRERTVRR